MSIYGAKITKGKIGANVSGRPFRTSAILTTGAAVPDKLVLGKTYTLNNPNDMDALGLTDTYDATHNVVVAEHVREFFRTSGGGAKLYLMVAPQETTLAQLLEGELHARKLLVDAKGEIFNLAIGFNPLSEYTETAVDGLNSEVRAGIVKAQALYQWSDENFRPVEIFLEGRGFSGAAVAALNLREIPLLPNGVLQAENVSIVIGQDWDYAEALTGHAKKYAAIGTALGNEANVAVNANIGEVDTQNLTDELKGKFAQAGLSNHTKVEELESSWKTLDDKGYIFPIIYIGISGYRWNDNHTCTPIIVDADGNMNCHNRAYGRTLDFSKRELRKKLLPHVKATKPVNVKTGLLPTGIIKGFEGEGNSVFEDFEASGWISGGTTKVNPLSDILIAKTLEVGFEVVPHGNIGAINGTINLKIKF